MRSYYNLMKLSETEIASDGSYYPDVMTLPTSDFVFSTVPIEYYLTSNDIERIDIFVGNTYGSSEYYDLILDINEIDHVKNKATGDPLYLPTLRELDDFFLRNR